jgi:hypothetical protein
MPHPEDPSSLSPYRAFVVQFRQRHRLADGKVREIANRLGSLQSFSSRSEVVWGCEGAR